MKGWPDDNESAFRIFLRLALFQVPPAQDVFDTAITLRVGRTAAPKRTMEYWELVKKEVI